MWVELLAAYLPSLARLLDKAIKLRILRYSTSKLFYVSIPCIRPSNSAFLVSIGGSARKDKDEQRMKLSRLVKIMPSFDLHRYDWPCRRAVKDNKEYSEWN
jgi:hypothetical protein